MNNVLARLSAFGIWVSFSVSDRNPWDLNPCSCEAPSKPSFSTSALVCVAALLPLSFRVLLLHIPSHLALVICIHLLCTLLRWSEGNRYLLHCRPASEFSFQMKSIVYKVPDLHWWWRERKVTSTAADSYTADVHMSLHESHFCPQKCPMSLPRAPLLHSLRAFFRAQLSLNLFSCCLVLPACSVTNRPSSFHVSQTPKEGLDFCVCVVSEPCIKDTEQAWSSWKKREHLHWGFAFTTAHDLFALWLYHGCFPAAKLWGRLEALAPDIGRTAAPWSHRLVHLRNTWCAAFQDKVRLSCIGSSTGLAMLKELIIHMSPTESSSPLEQISALLKVATYFLLRENFPRG